MRVLVVALVLSAAACGSATDPTDSGGTSNSNGTCGTTSTPNSTLTATIDGVQWRPVSVVARRGSAQTQPYLQVDTLDANCNLFGFVAAPFTGPLMVGTLQTSSSASNANYITVGGSPTWTAALSRGSGTIVVTNFSLTNNTGAGTFNFVLVGANNSTKTVTNGTFSVTFP